MMNIGMFLISDGWGGAETILRGMLKKLVQRNVKVFLVINNEILPHFQKLDGIEYINLGNIYSLSDLARLALHPRLNLITRIQPIRRGILDAVKRPLWLFYFHRMANILRRYFLRQNVTLLHSHLMLSNILAQMVHTPDLPLLCTIHSANYAFKKPARFTKSKFGKLRHYFGLTPLMLALNRRAVRRADQIVSVSDHIRQLLQSQYFSKRHPLTIHNGIALEHFAGLKSRPMDPDRLWILCPTGGKIQKGGLLVISALRDLVDIIPGIELYITLHVPHNHILRRKVQEYKLEGHVHFLGFLELREYHKILSAIDILCLPSQMEGFPTVILEAMAMGKVIVASNRGGIPEIITNGENGYLIEPTTEAVYNAIVDLHRHRSLFDVIKQNNLEKIQAFRLERVIDDYTRVYKNISRKQLSGEVCNR